MTANRELQDSAIRHQVYLVRVESLVARKMLGLLNKVDADMVARIAREPETPSGARLKRMLDRIREIQDGLRKQMKPELVSEMSAVGVTSANSALTAFQTVTGLTFESISPALIRAAATTRPFAGPHLKWATTGEHVDEAFRRKIQRVDAEIRMAVVEGQSIGQIVQRIRGTKALQFKDGVLEVSRREAETIARTAVNHISSRAREMFYEETGVAVGNRWLAILDSRTCLICSSRDGKQYGFGKGPRPPAHPSCRCTLTPVLRQNIGGAVPEVPVYGSWLKTQPRSFVEDVLGKSKAKLYLDGKLSLDRFVDNKGQILTLEELAVREAKAFERAGLAA
jgi:SPP1 gp7 family putative phage head morphogenesis protein